MKNVIAIILGGGAGTRLRPLTEYRSKPAVPFLGKYRLIDVPISNCLNSGINRIFVLTQFNGASLNHHIAETYRFDGFSDGWVSVLAAEQTPRSRDWYGGTADAVRQVLHHLNRYAYSHVLVLSGDQIYQMDYEEMLRHHIQFNADISVATVAVDERDAPRFGIVRSDDTHRIVQFREKPPAHELIALANESAGRWGRTENVFQASTGIYLFKRHVISDLLIHNPQFMDFGKEAIPEAIDSYQVVSYPFDGFWTDVGSIGSYFEANMLLARADHPLDLHERSRRLYSRSEVLPPARIYNSTINDAVIGEGSLIYDSKIDSAVLGPRSYVGSNSSIKQSVVLGTTYEPGAPGLHASIFDGADRTMGIGENCAIEKAIIDVNVSIGDGCVIANDERVQEAEGENYCIRDGIIVIPQDTEIPPGTIIGSGRKRPAKPARFAYSGVAAAV